MKDKKRGNYKFGYLGLPRSLDVFKASGRVVVMVLPEKVLVGKNADGGGSKTVIHCVDWLTGKQYIQGKSLPTQEARKEIEKERAFYDEYSGKIIGLPGSMIGVETRKGEKGEYTVYYQERCNGNLVEFRKIDSDGNQKFLLDGNQKLSIAYQLIQIFSRLDKVGVLYCDPKGENILFNRKVGKKIEVKVCDFGSMELLNKTWIESADGVQGEFVESLKNLLTAGTAGYVPPDSWIACYWLRVFSEYIKSDMFKGKLVGLSYEKQQAKKKKSLTITGLQPSKFSPKNKRDVFGLGILLLELYYTGRPLVGSGGRMDEVLCLSEIKEEITKQPFYVSDKDAVSKDFYVKVQENIDVLISEVKKSLDKGDSQSHQVLQLICKMTLANPKERITFSDAFKEMSKILKKKKSTLLRKSSKEIKKEMKYSLSGSSEGSSESNLARSNSSSIVGTTSSNRRRRKPQRSSTVAVSSSIATDNPSEKPRVLRRRRLKRKASEIDKSTQEGITNTTPQTSQRRRVQRSSTVAGSPSRDNPKRRKISKVGSDPQPLPRLRRRVGRSRTVAKTSRD